MDFPAFPGVDTMADSSPACEPTSIIRAGRISLHLALIAAGVVGMHLFLWAFADRRPGMQNVQWWQAIANLMHARGFFNVWTPYPPVFPAIFHLASSMLPAGTIRIAWQTCNILLLIGQAALIFVLVRRLLPGGTESPLKVSLLAVLAYVAAMWQPRSMVLLGPWMDQFDYLPAFLMLLGVFLLVRSGRTQGSPLRTQNPTHADGRTQGSPLRQQATWQETASAVMCGIGIMTKLFPGFLVLAAWPLLGWRRGLRYAGIALAVCVVLALPSAIANREMFISPVRYTSNRPAWESVWAYAFPAFGSRDPLPAMPPAPHPKLAGEIFTKPYRAENDPQLLSFASVWGPRRTFDPTNLIALPLLAGILAAVIVGIRYRARSNSLLVSCSLFPVPCSSSSSAPISSEEKSREGEGMTMKELKNGRGRGGEEEEKRTRNKEQGTGNRDGEQTGTALVRGSLIMLIGFLLCSKGFSTYFIVWIVPLLCIAYPGAGGFALSAALVLLGNVELLGYMGRFYQGLGNRDAVIFFTKLGPPGFQFWGAIFIRHIILMAVAVHQLHRLWNNREIAV